ncbi:hypothetical protein [Marinomonas sp. GJ51-6]|uniref:hypothetical protein n=1 Tax=Marinomonas sp. GJ51-6 TaxID=2992802 RepID=UPI002935318A|nr:hypothetical protein [Marinomonas sp. GJ51-6]WOD09057.1 hypothetical protein ONZ50_08545 [Marinomonas sp. GJ51-6]
MSNYYQIRHDNNAQLVNGNRLSRNPRKIVDIMQNSSKIDVPLLVEAGVGDNWDEAH